MKKIYVWTCDYCGKEFPTKKKSDQHELKCPKRKNKELKITINLGKLNKRVIFQSVLVFLAFYLLIFGLVSSYAKSNNLPPRKFLNPSSWFGEKKVEKLVLTPTPTSVIEPVFSPTSTLNNTSSSKNNVNNTIGNTIECIGPDGKQFNTTLSECEKLNKDWGREVDYIVDCKIHQDCGGGTQKLAKSICDNSICCEIPKGNWVFYTSKQKCVEDQNSSINSSNPSTFQLKTPQGEEKTCRVEGAEDISTYLKLMTQYLKDYNETGIDSYLDTGVEYEKKYYEAIARYCTP